MSGHNKWSQIKHKKGLTDQKRSQLFSKLVKAITVAAREEPNPDFNPRLRSAIETARKESMPSENILRALEKAKEASSLEELVLEAYGPGGIAIIMDAITDSKNRTISEVKHLLIKNDGKWAEPGSVGWAFERVIEKGEPVWKPKFQQQIAEEDRSKLEKLLELLDNHDDIQNIFHNCENL